MSNIGIVKPEPNAELVERLRELLDDAEAGRIRSAVVVYHSDAIGVHAHTTWIADTVTEKLSLVGAIRMAEHDILRQLELCEEEA